MDRSTIPVAALLLLADGRLPSGGYAHSGGLEATVRRSGVTDPDDLESFLRGRAATTGYVAACFAAATCARVRSGDTGQLARLDAELDARMPSPATREVSYSLGRQLLRALSSIHPHPLLAQGAGGIHQPIAYGLAAATFQLEPRDAAHLMLHEAVAGPAAAAAKVLPIDPYTVHAALARLTDLVGELAARAEAQAGLPPEELPALSSPLLDLAAEAHRSLEVHLFAS